MIYLVDALCARNRSIRFRSALKQFFSLEEKDRQIWEAYCSIKSMIPNPQHNKDLWIVVCDNTPFAFPILRNPMTRKGIDSENTFFVYYEDFSNHGFLSQSNYVMDAARRSLDLVYQKNGALDYEKLESHVFIVDSTTNKGMGRLVEAIRLKQRERS